MRIIRHDIYYHKKVTAPFFKSVIYVRKNYDPVSISYQELSKSCIFVRSYIVDNKFTQLGHRTRRRILLLIHIFWWRTKYHFAEPHDHNSKIVCVFWTKNDF